MGDWSDYDKKLTQPEINELIKQIQYIRSVCLNQLNGLAYSVVENYINNIENKLKELLH